MKELVEAAIMAVQRGNKEEAMDHLLGLLAVLDTQHSNAQKVAAAESQQSGEAPAGEEKPPWFNG